MSSADLRYRELQFFNQMWLRILIILPPTAVVASFIFTLTHDSPIGNMGTATDDWANWLFVFVVTFIPPVLLFTARLVIEVHDEELRFRFYPFHLHWHSIKWEEMQSAEARVYRPVREYGGWGIRLGRYGKAYNVSGNEGVLITLTNGNTIMFGSQYMRELELSIKTAIADAKPE